MTLSKETIELMKDHSNAIYPKEDIAMVITTTEEYLQEVRHTCFYEGMEYALTNPAILASVKGEEWVRVEDRLPTKDDVFDDYDEVLTIQVGRKRPTMMKYWEIKHCPFTKFWLSVPKLPTPPKTK